MFHSECVEIPVQAESWFFGVMSNLLRFRPLLSSVSSYLDERLALPQRTSRSVRNTPFRTLRRRAPGPAALVVCAAGPGALGGHALVPSMAHQFEPPGVPVAPIQSISGDSVYQPQHCWHLGWLILCSGWWDWGSCPIIVGCSSILDFYALEASSTVPRMTAKKCPHILPDVSSWVRTTAPRYKRTLDKSP